MLYRGELAAKGEELFATGNAPGFSPSEATRRSSPWRTRTKYILLQFFELKNNEAGHPLSGDSEHRKHKRVGLHLLDGARSLCSVLLCNVLACFCF